MTSRVFLNKEKVEYFFAQSKDNSGSYICTCGKERRQKPNSGFQNLVEHIERAHPDWKEIMSETEKGSNSKLTY